MTDPADVGMFQRQPSPLPVCGIFGTGSALDRRSAGMSGQHKLALIRETSAERACHLYMYMLTDSANAVSALHCIHIACSGDSCFQ